MSTIINIENINPLRPASSVPPSPTRERTAPRSAVSDTVEISDLGRASARAMEESSLRIARNRAIRAEIENGTYETRERIDATAERLLDVIA